MSARCLLLALLFGSAAPLHADLVRGALLLDGTGAPGRVMDLRFERGVVTALGDLEALPGEVVIDGAGRVLAPGFVDTHSPVSYTHLTLPTKA